jgi:hypothetical protein
VAVKTTDSKAAKVIEDEMYKVRVDGHMINPDDHKRTDGHQHDEERKPEPVAAP